MDDPLSRRLIRSLLAVAAFGALAAGALPADAAPGAGDWALCARNAAAAERAEGLPPYLLTAIGKVESGRWNAKAGAVFAWPWTVIAEGRGRFLPSRDAAVAEVRALKARGLVNIDEGCMQVNLKYHPEVFASLDEAFDPARNTAYAAAYLKRLHVEARSWTRAIGLYHSRTPRFSGPYRRKVYHAWRSEKHQARRSPGALAFAAPVQQGQNLGGIGRPSGPVGRAQAPLVPNLRVGPGRQ